MNRHKDPLTLVKQLADMAELKKSQQVAASIVSLSTEEERLAVLERYLAEYQLGGSRERPVGIGLLKSRHAFLAALAEAVRAQSEQVKQLRAQFERKLNLWRDAKARASAVERFTDRRADERERASARAEQTALDDSGRWPRPRE